MDDHTAVRPISVKTFSINVCIIYLSFPQCFGGMSRIHFKIINMHHYRISRSSQFQVEDLVEPSTSSPANEMTASEKVVSIKEEESMEYYCDDIIIVDAKPTVSCHSVPVRNTTRQGRPPNY